jgi:hypothetical protein
MVHPWCRFVTCRAACLRRSYGGLDVALVCGKVLHPSSNSAQEPLICRDPAGSHDPVHTVQYRRRLAHQITRELRGERVHPAGRRNGDPKVAVPRSRVSAPAAPRCADSQAAALSAAGRAWVRVAEPPFARAAFPEPGGGGTAPTSDSASSKAGSSGGGSAYHCH